MKKAISHIADCCPCPSDEKSNKPVFVLIKQNVYNFDECVQNIKTIKFSHLVARGKSSLPWIGSGVFSKVSAVLGSSGDNTFPS